MPKIGRVSTFRPSVSGDLPAGPGSDRTRAERILALSRAGTWEWDLSTNANVWSEELWPLYGLDPDQDIPSYETWLQSVLPEDREPVERAIQDAVAKGAVFDAVWRVNVMADEPERWLMSRGVPIRGCDGDVSRYVGTVRDCTEWLRAEDAVYSRELHETIPGAFAIVDARGRMKAWNRYEAEVIIGRPLAEIGGMDSFESIHPDDRDYVMGKFRNVLDEGVEESGEARVLLHGGPRYMWRMINGRRVFIDGEPCVMVISTDITRRRQFESLIGFRVRLLQMVESATEEELLRATLDEAAGLTDSGAAFCWFRSGIPTQEPFQVWSTGAMEAIAGCGEGQAHASAVNSRIWDEVRISAGPLINNDAESIRCSRLIGGWPSPISRELVVPHMSGDGLIAIFGVFNRAYDYDDSDAFVLEQLAGLAWDIVVRKRAEHAEAARQNQLQQSQKMALLGQLAGGVAHEYNNMLSIILGHAEILLDSVDESHRFAGSLDAIRRATLRSADLTKQLLGFARRQTLQPEVISPDAAVARFMSVMSGIAGEEIECRLEAGATGAMIEIDVSQFEQVLANLCLNARDALSGGGRITIATRLQRVAPGDPDPVCAGPGPGDYVALAVTDNGCGIAEEHLPHIFEPFFTTKRVGMGAGLGLSTVYGIMSQNGGSVRCHTEEGRGTTVEVCFPLHRSSSPPAACDDGTSDAGSGGPNILLVEDEPNICKLLTDLLQGRGYTVAAAANAEEALALSMPRIDLLLTDVVLPGMNGVELCGRMQQRDPAMQCLFMSGYAPESIEKKGVLKEGVNFIRKPFGIRELVAAVVGMIASSADGSKKN
ncbi:ATP-binding protein [Chlorobium sp. N1]|uniref:ATP-binding protein n=1 Tax=Chlorobium sp. N1 TaxID=2491138 RepID=UPI001039B60A|nr:ATP-binding protein [Chlorobium sp. N1]TCD47619.1 response regulator [Chlorobium sp. N1]